MKTIFGVVVAAAFFVPVFAGEADHSATSSITERLHISSEDLLDQLSSSSDTEDNKYFVTIKANQSLMSLAREYGLTLIELKNLNPGIELSQLGVGSRIRIASGGHPGTAGLISSIPDRSLKALKSEGKSCNVFNRSFYSNFNYVEDKTTAMAYLMTSYEEPLGTYKSERPKGVTPFDRYTSRPTLSEVTTDCAQSQVKLFCTGGSCFVLFNSKEYGYHPSYRSTVIVDGKKYSWVGDQPDWIGRELWGLLREGSVVKSSLALWPSGRTNFRDKLNGVAELKNIIYKESLRKE